VQTVTEDTVTPVARVIEHAPDAEEDALSLRAGVQQALKAVEQALSPPRCAGCGWFSPHLFCEVCAPRVRRVGESSEICHCCGEPFDPRAVVAAGSLCSDCRGPGGKIATPLAHARSLWELRGPVRRAVHAFKYRRHTALADALGAHLSGLAHSDGVLAQAGVVVPVPLHAGREWMRGFNQSELLARHVARQMRLPCVGLLRRARHTPTQTTLARSARDANVHHAFALNPRVAARGKYLCAAWPEPKNGKNRAELDALSWILLVDDVWTTGATLRECARVLREAGFPNVCAVTLARRGKAHRPTPPEIRR
jgi:predicted amidophosphoribosyltransferase